MGRRPYEARAPRISPLRIPWNANARPTQDPEYVERRIPVAVVDSPTPEVGVFDNIPLHVASECCIFDGAFRTERDDLRIELPTTGEETKRLTPTEKRPLGHLLIKSRDS